MEDENKLEIPKLTRQKAQCGFLFGNRHENIELFLNCFYSKRSIQWPNLYYFPFKYQRDFIIDSRYILKRFTNRIYKRKIFHINKISNFLINFFNPDICNLILCYLFFQKKC